MCVLTGLQIYTAERRGQYIRGLLQIHCRLSVRHNCKLTMYHNYLMNTRQSR